MDKARIWEKKQGKYAKTLAKIRVTADFLMQDMRRIFFTQIYRDLHGDGMLVSNPMSTNVTVRNQQKHMSLRFATEAWIYFLRNSKTLKW